MLLEQAFDELNSPQQLAWTFFKGDFWGSNLDLPVCKEPSPKPHHLKKHEDLPFCHPQVWCWCTPAILPQPCVSRPSLHLTCHSHYLAYPKGRNLSLLLVKPKAHMALHTDGHGIIWILASDKGLAHNKNGKTLQNPFISSLSKPTDRIMRECFVFFKWTWVSVAKVLFKAPTTLSLPVTSLKTTSFGPLKYYQSLSLI